THAVIFRIVGHAARELPLWMNEGLAKYESREVRGPDDVLVANAAAEGTLIPLSNLVSMFPESRTALAYAESASAVRYLVSKHGRAAPRAILAALARTRSFDKAMLEVTGRTGDAFADEWTTHVSRRYWALRATRIGAAAVSVLMAVLAVVAFFVRRKQKIEAARQWEEEEQARRYRGYPWPPWEE
ncbi:MAG: peptidase MA family metallohydrolase, partial [Armatimonadota bacterium]